MNGDNPLRLTTPSQMADYLTGNGSRHNNPTLLCSGDGFRVTTQLRVKQFRPDQYEEACRFLKMMLEEEGYVELTVEESHDS